MMCQDVLELVLQWDMKVGYMSLLQPSSVWFCTFYPNLTNGKTEFIYNEITDSCRL